MIVNVVYHSFCLVSRQKLKRGEKMARIIDGESMNLIGLNVKKYRKDRRMSQQMLSLKLELMGVYVCRGSISRIEDRSRTVTDIELYAIAEVLGVTVNNLFDK